MDQNRDALLIGHASDGRLVRRPLSPHLQVYRPQLTSVLSIMNRVTGIALCAGAAVMVWWIAAAAAGPVAFGHVQWFLHTWLGVFLMFGWTAALFYHFFGGLRHLAWDFGFGYDLETVHASGWAVIIATVVFTLAVWIIGLFMGGIWS